MNMKPLVSIIIPVYDDESMIAGALQSCSDQTLSEIEIIVVDDASTDDSVGVVRKHAARDPRIRLIAQPENRSAYQARRVGILEAKADFVLFLDGDDEFATNAVAAAYAKARATNADIVQFGIDVVANDGTTGGGFETRLQPRNGSLRGTAILPALFPIDQPAQGQLWRFLFRTEILRAAYALMPDDLILPRVNDLPITFLAIALASRFESIPDRLYRYHFGRGGSGQRVHDLSWAMFYAGAIHSINTIATAVRTISERADDPTSVAECYESARLSIIGYTTYYLATHTSETLKRAVFEHLYTCATPREIVQATAKFWPSALPALAAQAPTIALPERAVNNILLTTNILRTGGVSGVLVSQARYLMQAGFHVTIAAREHGSDESAIPAGASFVQIAGENLAAELQQWSEVCIRDDIDLVIDHHWLYSKNWAAFALAARAEGAKTFGWAHNFAGRAILLGLRTLSVQTRNMPALAQLVVLSPLDVAFWKLRGMSNVVYLPNPPSPLLLDSPVQLTAKTPPAGRRVELIWWGRLEQRTKRVSELITIAAELKKLNVDFRMRIIGPDWTDMSATRLTALAAKHSVAEYIDVPGPLYGDDLIAAIDEADMFINASVIEGYPLTLPEAQSRGLPIAMYKLPWLALAAGNDGIVTAPQGDAVNLALQIAAIVNDSGRYVRMSAASVAAARRELDMDFGLLYRQLVTESLPAAYSPEPTIEDAKALVDITVAFAEHGAATRAQSKSRQKSRKAPPQQAAHEPVTVRTRIVRALTPTAEAVLDTAPWLRPAAKSVKHRLLRH